MPNDAVILNVSFAELVSLLTCPMSAADGKRKPCVFAWSGTETRCERCGTLTAEWILRVQAALDALEPQPADDAQNVQRILGALATIPPALPTQSPHDEAHPIAICEGCGSELPEEATFCPQCGRTNKAPLSCRNCGAAWGPDTKFCPKCGAKAV